MSDTLLSKKAFADRCGINTSYLSTDIGRGKVLVTKKGKEDYIDITVETNKAYMLKRAAKRGKNLEEKTVEQTSLTIPEHQESPKNSEETPETTTDQGDKGADKKPFDDTSRDLHRLNKEKIDLDNRKRQQEIQLLELKQKKLNGEVVPTEAIKKLFQLHTRTIVVAFKNAGEEFITKIAALNGLNYEQITGMRGDLTKTINEAVANALQQSIAGVEGIVAEYSESKEVGERA